jgi:Zn-dependent M28 family amino/carboxypeptidase
MHASLFVLMCPCPCQVDREQTSGAVNLEFINTPITNAYRNLTNIILRIVPKNAQHRKAVLINAHFDTVFESPGVHLIFLELCTALYDEVVHLFVLCLPLSSRQS